MGAVGGQTKINKVLKMSFNVDTLCALVVVRELICLLLFHVREAT